MNRIVTALLWALSCSFAVRGAGAINTGFGIFCLIVGCSAAGPCRVSRCRPPPVLEVGSPSMTRSVLAGRQRIPPGVYAAWLTRPSVSASVSTRVKRIDPRFQRYTLRPAATTQQRPSQRAAR